MMNVTEYTGWRTEDGRMFGDWKDAAEHQVVSDIRRVLDGATPGFVSMLEHARPLSAVLAQYANALEQRAQDVVGTGQDSAGELRRAGRLNLETGEGI